MGKIINSSVKFLRMWSRSVEMACTTKSCSWNGKGVEIPSWRMQSRLYCSSWYEAEQYPHHPWFWTISMSCSYMSLTSLLALCCWSPFFSSQYSFFCFDLCFMECLHFFACSIDVWFGFHFLLSGWGFWTGKVAAKWRHGGWNKNNWNIWVRSYLFFLFIFCIY